MEKLGRSSRLQYLGFIFLPFVGLTILGGLFLGTSETAIDFATFSIYALWAIGSIRRTNDIGHSWGIVLLLLVPYINVGLMLYLLFASKDSARDRRLKKQLETQEYLQKRLTNPEPRPQIEKELASSDKAKFCSNCGRKSKEGETFCSDCGNKLEA